MVSQITAEELADLLDAGESVTLIDTRPAESYDAWHIPDAENVPFDPRRPLDESTVQRVHDLAGDGPVVTVCARGVTSGSFALDLEGHGFDDVTVVKGGMADWSAVYEVVPVATVDLDIVILQLQRRAKGCLGYLVGSRRADEVAVVDPTRHTDVFKVAAEEAGLLITRVVDTHVHADHLSGGRRLADEVGAPYYLGERAAERDVQFDFEPVADGDALAVGDIDLTARYAPGHTSDLLTYRVGDEALLSTDALFVDAVGRTELQFGEADAARGAATLFDSLHGPIAALPDDTTVLPGHVTVTPDGRFRGGTPGEPVTARLGDLFDSLDLLALDKEAFVERLAGRAPATPPNYDTIVAVNTGRETATGSRAIELELGPNNCAA